MGISISVFSLVDLRFFYQQERIHTTTSACLQVFVLLSSASASVSNPLLYAEHIDIKTVGRM
jgi:hypothetical protein